MQVRVVLLALSVEVCLALNRNQKWQMTLSQQACSYILAFVTDITVHTCIDVCLICMQALPSDLFSHKRFGAQVGVSVRLVDERHCCS